jgi:hypothetical protein
VLLLKVKGTTEFMDGSRTETGIFKLTDFPDVCHMVKVAFSLPIRLASDGIIIANSHSPVAYENDKSEAFPSIEEATG